MSPSKEAVLAALSRVALPGGGDIVGRDLVRALQIEPSSEAAGTDSAQGLPGASIRFVLEAESPEAARQMEPIRQQAEAALRALPGVARVSVVLTAHGPAAKAAPPAAPAAPAAPAGAVSARSGAAAGAPPSLTIGGHPQPAPAGPQPVSGIARILAVGSGKGGVGKSTVSSNLAVALARQGRRVGLLDADIYGPSQHKMMGVSGKPASPDGKTIEPMQAHGVTMMSIGLMLKADEAVIWRGPMLMGALQQLIGQVNWGALDVLIIDLPPGTGDVQLSLCQRTKLTGAIVVSTPQDVALLDARRAIDMFGKLKTPVLGLIENMSTYICPNCGHEAHLFGHGGVAAEAQALGLPFLGEIPLNLDVRLAGDAGRPIAAGAGPISDAYGRLARRLIDGGMA